MRKRFIKRDPHTNSFGIPQSGRGEHKLVSLIARSQQHQLDVFPEQLIQHRLDQIQAFLSSQPRDDGQNWNVWILGKTEDPLQISLAG